METVIYFVLVGALVLLMMRFGCGAHVMGHGHGRSRNSQQPRTNAPGRFVQPDKDTDPVCGMAVTTATALSSAHAGRVYFFCSASCREKFEASPASFPTAKQPTEAGHGSYH